MKSFWLSLFAVVALVSFASAANWQDPANCPTTYLAQSCIPIKVCGVDGSSIAYCWDTTSFVAPVGSPDTETTYGGTGGWQVDCYAFDGANPRCDNAGSYWCGASAACTATHNKTTCTGGVWLGSSCSNTCTTGWESCPWWWGSCAISAGNTNCDPDNTGKNCKVQAGCGLACSSGYLDCDAGGVNATNGCEVQDGGACSVGGIPGTYSGCTCVTTPQHHLTGIQANGSSTLPNLWTQQFGLGWIFNGSSDNTGNYLGINASGCLIMNSFLGDSYSCDLTGGGTTYSADGEYVYEVIPTVFSFNQTAENITIDTIASFYNETVLIDAVNTSFVLENTTIWGYLDNFSGYFGTLNASIFQPTFFNYSADEWWIKRNAINATDFNFTLDIAAVNNSLYAQWNNGTSFYSHGLLSGEHNDTNESKQGNTSRGEMLYVNTGLDWDSLRIGAAGYVLMSIGGFPAWHEIQNDTAGTSVNYTILDENYLRINSNNSPFYNLLQGQGAIWLRSNTGNLTHNSTPQVPASAYPDVLTVGGTDFGTALNGSMTFLFAAHDYRIREDGNVSGASFYLNTIQGVVYFTIDVWRKNSAGTYDMIGTSGNLSVIAVGQNNVTFASPIQNVREGDFVGATILKNFFFNNQELKGRSVTTGQTYYVPYAIPPLTNGVAWETAPSQNLVLAPFVLMMNAPQAIFIGDSLMTGHCTNASYRNTGFASNSDFTSLNTSIPYKTRTALGWTAQNLAIGGEELGWEIIDRFQKDVIDMHPQVVFINGGTNDIFANQSQADFITNYTLILDDTKANSIFTVVMSIPPANCSALAPPNYTKCDYIEQWNTALEALVEGYDNAIYVNTKDYVGCLNSTGDGWETCAEYTDDQLHFNPDGNSKIAEAFLHYTGGERATSLFAEQFVSNNGMTFNEKGLPISSAFDTKTTWFGRGGGGTSVFADNAEYNQYGELIAHTDLSPLTGKASAIVMGDGRILRVAAEGTSDGEQINNWVSTSQDSVNRTWVRKQVSSASVYDEASDTYRDIFLLESNNATTPVYAPTSTALTTHTNDLTGYGNYYYNHNGADYLIEIDGGQRPIYNVTNNLGRARFYTTSTNGLTLLSSLINITGTGVYDGVSTINAYGTTWFQTGILYIANASGIWEEQNNTYRWSTSNGTTWNASNVTMNGSLQDLLWGSQILFSSTLSHSQGDQWRFSVVTDAPILVYDGNGEQVFDVDRYGTIRSECHDKTCVWLGSNDTAEGMGLGHGDGSVLGGYSFISDNAQWLGNINVEVPTASDTSGIIFWNGNITFYSDTGETAGIPFAPTQRMQIGDKPNVWINETNYTAIKIGKAQTGTSTNLGRVLDTGSFFLDDADFNGTNYVARDTAAGGIGMGGGITSLYAQTGLTSGNVFTPQNRLTAENDKITVNSPNNAYNFTIKSNTSGLDESFSVNQYGYVGVRTGLTGLGTSSVFRVNGTDRTGLKFSLNDTGAGTSIGRFTDSVSYFANNIDWSGTSFTFRAPTAEVIVAGAGIIGIFINTSVTGYPVTTTAPPKDRYYFTSTQFYPTTNKTQVSGLGSLAWDYVYSDDFINVGSWNYMKRDLQSELLQYIPQDKKEGEWDYEKDGQVELDPNSLPPNIAHNEPATDKNGKVLVDGKGEPINVAGIRVNELAAYDYAANVQQQQAINELNKTVEAQAKEINELRKQVAELQCKVFGIGC